MGNGFVLEAVNLALRSDPSPQVVHRGCVVVSLNQFFFQESGDRPRDRDPRPLRTPSSATRDAYFDSAANGHWFVTALSIDTDPATGAVRRPSRACTCGQREQRSNRNLADLFNRDDERDGHHARSRRVAPASVTSR